MILNKKWNIIIVTLFITLIIWLIWLLITKYVFNLVQISSENYKYYKAYYIAYAGIELELWKMKGHGMWFDDEITWNSQTIRKNFTWVNYNFSVKNISLSHYISSNPKSLLWWNNYCADKKNWVKLWTWDGLLTPLVYDKASWEALYSGKNMQILHWDFTNTKLYYSWDIVLWYISNTKKKIFNIPWNWNISLNDKFSVAWITYPTDVTNSPFVVIWAKEASSICMENTSNKLVSPYSYVVSKWNFMDRTVVLKVIKHHKWANFSIYGLY